MGEMVEESYESLKDRLGDECKKAYLGNRDDFTTRWKFGMVAQKLFLDKIQDSGIEPVDSDNFNLEYRISMCPKPDFEFDNCFFEIRRQDFFDPVLLGQRKKYDGWKYHSIKKAKTLYFCMLSKNLINLAYSNLTENASKISLKQNAVGDIDYCIPLDAFNIRELNEGIQDIVKIIQDVKPTLDEWI